MPLLRIGLVTVLNQIVTIFDLILSCLKFFLARLNILNVVARLLDSLDLLRRRLRHRHSRSTGRRLEISDPPTIWHSLPIVHPVIDLLSSFLFFWIRFDWLVKFLYLFRCQVVFLTTISELCDVSDGKKFEKHPPPLCSPTCSPGQLRSHFSCPRWVWLSVSNVLHCTNDSVNDCV